MKPRSAKAKGTRLEKWVADAIKAIPGFTAGKQPGSGIYQDFPHDVRFSMPDGREWRIECKARKAGLTTISRWLGEADILVLRNDYQAPWVAMPWAQFTELLNHISGLGHSPCAAHKEPAEPETQAHPPDRKASMGNPPAGLGSEEIKERIAPRSIFPQKPKGYVSPLSKEGRTRVQRSR